MAKLMRDPGLEALVRELNDAEPPSEEPRTILSWPSGSIPEGNALEALLIEVAQRGASDLLIVAGAPPIFRVGGRLSRANDGFVMRLHSRAEEVSMRLLTAFAVVIATAAVALGRGQVPDPTKHTIVDLSHGYGPSTVFCVAV